MKLTCQDIYNQIQKLEQIAQDFDAKVKKRENLEELLKLREVVRKQFDEQVEKIKQLQHDYCIEHPEAATREMIKESIEKIINESNYSVSFYVNEDKEVGFRYRPYPEVDEFDEIISILRHYENLICNLTIIKRNDVMEGESRFTDLESQKLMDALEQHDCKVSTIDLSSNGIGYYSLKIIADEFEFTRIKSINLSANRIDDRCYDFLVRMLENPKLETLILENVPMSEGKIKKLGKICQKKGVELITE